MKILIVALTIRLSLFVIINPVPVNDSKEYLMLSNNIKTTTEWKYDNWTERSFLYVLFLKVFGDISIFLQMFLGSIGVLLFYKMNKTAGWIWNFYGCWYDILYLKESLIFFMIINFLYFIKRRSYELKISW